MDDLNLYQGSPESVVRGFYEMFVNDPDSALVLVDSDARESDRFKRKFDKIRNWKFNKVDVGEYHAPYIDVTFEIEIDGEVDGGTNQAKVVEKDGKWWIVMIPS